MKKMIMMVALMVATSGWAGFDEDKMAASNLKTRLEMIAAYRVLLDNYPDATNAQKISVYSAIGINLAAVNKRDEAIIEYQKIIDNPDATNAQKISVHSAIAAHLIALNRRDEAIAEYQKILDNPDAIIILKISVHSTIAVQLVALKRQDEAIAEYQKILDNPDATTDQKINAQRAIAVQLVALKRHDEAILKYESLVTEFNVPLSQRYIYEYGTTKNILEKAPLDDIFRIILSRDEIKYIEFSQSFLNRLIAEANSNVKKILRLQEKTFIGEEGQANIMELLQPIVDAMNSPAMKGIEDALAGVNVNIKPLDRTHVISFGKEIADKIMFGELEPDKVKYIPHVYIALGFDAFNEWMEAYNTGKLFDWSKVYPITEPADNDSPIEE